MKRIPLGLFAALAALGCGGAVVGAPPTPVVLEAVAKRVVEDDASYTNWTKVCSNEQASEFCYVIRDAMDGEGQVRGSLSLHKNGDGYLFVVEVPAHSLVPFGVTWQVDNGEQLRIRFRVCQGDVCLADVASDASGLASLRRGLVLTLGFHDRQNKEHYLSVDLRGFTQATNGF